MRKVYPATGLLVLAALLAFAPHPARADVEQVQATTSHARVGVGETFVYRVTVTGTGSPPSPSVDIPAVFQILSGPNSNLSMQWVNGAMSSERTITYRLRANRKGEHTFPAPQVRDGNTLRKGNPVTVIVGDAPDPPPAAGRGQGGSGPGASAQPRQRSITPGQSRRGRQAEPIFVEASLSEKEVWLQQPVTVTYRLYYRPQVRTFNVDNYSSTEGFWSEQVETPNPPEVVQRSVDGVAYNVAVIHKTLLFPTRTGELTVGPMTISLQYVDARRRPTSIFDSFFDQGLVEGHFSSDPLTVHVRPLPEGGRPEDFDNVVGDFELESALSADTVAANESVTFTLAVTGRGNVGFVPVPELEVGPDVELYEPQVKEEHSVRADNVQGSKVFTWLMIPRRPGRQRIPALELPYFDPEAGRYRIARAKEQTLVVRGTAGWAGEEAPADVARGDVETLATDIRWILASTRGLSRQGPPLRARTGYWLAWLAPLFIVAGAFGLRRQLAARAGREGQIRSRKAARRAREALKQAREALGGGDVEVGYEALARGLTGYVADRIGVPAAQLDRARIQRELSQRPISEASRSELAAILDLCDTARFTPEGGDPEALRKLIERSGRWIDSVDRPLGAKERL